jgi:eukaryotic-like serine/threonine-protein kinase
VVSRAGTTFDFLKVLDFGLVKLDSPRGGSPDGIKLSGEDSWSGTPGYMAPEVVLGAADTDHRVDLYALGCVAYWLLTGTLVFEGESAMQVMFKHVQAAPTPPSERTDRPIPAALEAVIMECLEKEPVSRPASAAVVSERLAAVPLSSPWTAERAEEWWATHRPRPRDARPVADMLLSHEGHELRIGPRVRPRG